MDQIDLEKLSLLPEEMLSFTLSSFSRSGPRVGSLALKGRSTMKTPCCIGNTSRGAVPHVSQDNLARYRELGGLYVGLEDCMLLLLSFFFFFTRP